MESTITTGLLAYGMSGKVFHAPFIHAHPGFKLHAVTERTHKNAAEHYPEIKSYDSVDELIDDPAIDLVIINTPNYTHYDYAKKALSKGKHILVEKPFTATLAEADELFGLAKSLGKQIFVYQNRRWDSDFLAVKKILDEGVLGKVHEVNFRFDRYRAAISPKSFKEEPMPASGMQYDLGPHLLDQVISLFGQPQQFYKILGKNRAQTKVDDYFSIHLSYPDSLNVFVHANMMVVDVQPAFVIHGTKGSFVKQRTDVQETQLLGGRKPTDASYGLEPADTEGQLTLIDEEGNKSQRTIPAEQGIYLSLFEAVYQSLVHQVPYPITEADVRCQLRILEAPAATLQVL